MSTAPALSIRGLNKSFGAIVVAQSIDVDLKPGARVGLIGPNGAGKTTFVNLLTGFLKPDSGSINLEGTQIEGMAPEMRVKRGLARTHQINALLREFNVRDNVAIAVAERKNFAWRMMRYTPQWQECLDESQALLDQMGIGVVADRIVRELPYGRQRLLEIAIALSLKPRVLLLDEPVAGVPTGEREELLETVAALPDDVSVLLIEHDMDLVFSFADRMTVLVNGTVLTEGEPDAIANDARVKEVYLGGAAHV